MREIVLCSFCCIKYGVINEKKRSLAIIYKMELNYSEWLKTNIMTWNLGERLIRIE